MPEDEVRRPIDIEGLDVNDEAPDRSAPRRFGVRAEALTYHLANLGIDIDRASRL